MEMFPEGSLCEEKFLGLTKSFIVHYGWNIHSQTPTGQTLTDETG